MERKIIRAEEVAKEKDIMYDPLPSDKPMPLKKPKNKDYER